MCVRSRRMPPGRWLVGWLACAVALGAAGATPPADAFSETRVEVPAVVGLPKKEAARRLAAAGLKARYVLPVGSRVVEQSPGRGEQARRGSSVQLLLNLF